MQEMEVTAETPQNVQETILSITSVQEEIIISAVSASLSRRLNVREKEANVLIGRINPIFFVMYNTILI